MGSPHVRVHVREKPLALPAPHQYDPNQMLSNFPLWFWVPREADTYHDFRPACAVEVMCAVSTPRLHCRVVVMMRLPDEFDMMIQSPKFVGGTVIDDLPEYGGVEKTLKVSSPSAL